jgi:hypothetical protein
MTTGNPMQELDQLWFDIPTGSPRVPELLEMGRKVKRTRRIAAFAGIGVFTMVTILALGAGSQLLADDDALARDDAASNSVSAEIVVTPAVVTPGELVSLSFPNNLDRGIGYTLENIDDGRRYILTSDAGGMGMAPAWSEGQAVWFGIGIGGPGPDRIVIPSVATPGQYDLCTGTSIVPVCVTLTVS